jgi:hypothetical protein
MASPMTREDLQLLPMKIYEERRQMEVDKFIQRVHKEVLTAASSCRTSLKVPINTRNPDDFALASAILFRKNMSILKPLPEDEMAMVLSILKINLTSMYPDSTIMSVMPTETRRGAYILIDWS